MFAVLGTEQELLKLGAIISFTDSPKFQTWGGRGSLPCSFVQTLRVAVEQWGKRALTPQTVFPSGRHAASAAPRGAHCCCLSLPRLGGLHSLCGIRGWNPSVWSPWGTPAWGV